MVIFKLDIESRLYFSDYRLDFDNLIEHYSYVCDCSYGISL